MKQYYWLRTTEQKESVYLFNWTFLRLDLHIRLGRFKKLYRLLVLIVQ